MITMKIYTPDVIAFANEIAEKLNDKQSINTYLKIAERYKEEHIRRILDKVLSIPPNEIRKTPGALFTFLIMQRHESRYYGRD